MSGTTETRRHLRDVQVLGDTVDVWVRYGEMHGVTHTRKVCGLMHRIMDTQNETQLSDFKSYRELSKCFDIIVRTRDAVDAV